MNFLMLLPEWTAIASLLVLLTAEILKNPKDKAARSKAPWNLALAGSFLTLAAIFPLAGKTESLLNGVLILDPLALFFKGFFTVAATAVIFMAREFFKDRLEKPSEFLLILWSSLIALFFLVSANDLLLMFVAIETFTLSLYVMAAYLKRDLISIEAGLKYLIIGSLASAFLIYGISLIYVAAGSTSLVSVRGAYALLPENKLILLGILFIISGLGFKVASVPFQLWAPDVYEGAPTPVVSYLSVASKAAGFALLMRLLFSVFMPFESSRVLLFSVLAAMTLLYGNLAALLQTNIKRLFGYSGITHAGYLLVALAAGKEMGITAILYYLIAYGLSNLAAFLVITLVGREAGNDRIDSYRGLGKRSPFLAGVLFISLLSLAGVPPLAGFFGKFLVLFSAVRADLLWLALLGALGVAVSLYYYLNLVRVMYFDESGETAPLRVPLSIKAVLIFLVLGIILAGFWQAPFFTVAHEAAKSLF